ncbi:hypothetical protein RCG19_21960 [Neobacillus sp. OS1-2]|uniref:hypothetical protein n=1 Tax=Neobacillus sp. OS1-2 TaxID=3070680 RepID=UPI0027DF3CEA|nr:hypothetical protein [Neobacillus sp. OS1-2]WML39801.1 hypothetical protein RCG19_21960 [Neobacillus sp. OS1-2]
METENKYIFYYNIDKIQAITKNTKQFQPDISKVEFQKTQSLTELLHSFQHTWVTILSINKQQFSGVLSEIDTDFATLINGEERILIKLTHVSNILKGFIKEETTKSETTEGKEENKNEAKNNEDEAKEEESTSCHAIENKTENKSDNKSKQPIKATSVTSEKKGKAHTKREKPEMIEKPLEVAAAVEINEPNNTMVWSHPIKIEAPVIQPLDTPPITTHKKQQSTSETTANKGKIDLKKTTNEMKKPNNEMKQKENKNEEPSTSKPKPIEPVKEIKPVKEATIKMETKPAAILPPPKKDDKPAKSHESTTASKPILSHNSSPKKTENTTSEKFVNDTKNVWKQKDQEKKAFRFAGEPVSRDQERAFPFAGWPSKNKRTFRF